MPQRIQLSRRKGFRLQLASFALNELPAVNVARPSRYGNPHAVGLCAVCGVEHTRDEAISDFERGCDNPEVQMRIKENLRGKNLACWCKLTDNCHADVLLRIANK